MSRRYGTRGGRRGIAGVGATSTPDPLEALAARAAWRAEDAVVGGGTVSSWPSYVGSYTLLPAGAEKGEPVADALLNDELAIPSAGTGLGYTVALAAPTAQTLVAVGRYNTASSAFLAHTVGGTVNSGQSLFYQAGAGVNGRCLAATAASPNVAVLSFVAVTVLTSTGSTHYVNAKTAVTASGGPTALAGNSLRVFDLSSDGVFPLTGAIARLAEFDRALNATEAGQILDYYGALYGITIAA